MMPWRMLDAKLEHLKRQGPHPREKDLEKRTKTVLFHDGIMNQSTPAMQQPSALSSHRVVLCGVGLRASALAPRFIFLAAELSTSRPWWPSTRESANTGPRRTSIVGQCHTLSMDSHTH